MLSTTPALARSILEAAPDAMVIIDAGGVISYANRQVAALFGFGPEEIIGAAIEQLIPERFRDRHIGHRDGYVHNLRVRPMGLGLALYARRKDGSEFPVEISLSPIQDGERILVAAAIRDVSDRQRAEAQLIVAREAAEAAREMAERANQGKSRFLATASHDLRQPLQTLALLNGTLRRLVSDPDANFAIEQQDLAIGTMSRLLNALLDISKLESGAIKPDPTDFKVAELFRELKQEFTETAARKGLALKVDESVETVHSDPSLVEQILRNLVSNAIKYTHQGSVWLRSVRTGPAVCIEVLDTGIGIPANQIAYIYDEFYQVGVAANTTRDGYGLGLSIVSRLVQLLGLRLDVDSELGKGSTFRLSLPSCSGQISSTQRAVTPAPIHEATQRPGLLLLVEDDPAVRSATQLLLKVEGHRVLVAGTRAEALQKAREHPIDLLITDYHLGDGETGTELIAAIRSALGRPLKAILMTGDTSSAIRELGSDQQLRIVSKPVNAEELLELLATLLSS